MEPAHQVWVGSEAAIDKVPSWHRAAIAHFSGHGFGHPRFAALSHLRLSDDLLLAHDVIYRQPSLPDGSLVILNGCQTGVRDWRAVDEGLGLMSRLSPSRARSLTLATQWNVADPCAAVMVTVFLSELVKKGPETDRALRSAQERAREIRTDEVEGICQSLRETRFPPDLFPHEAARLDEVAMRACLRAGHRTAVRHYAQRAAMAWRSVGLLGQADRVEACQGESGSSCNFTFSARV